MRSFVLSALLVAASMTLAACGGHDEGGIDDVIGAACTSNNDCDSKCYTDSGDFPGGFCSLPCHSDDECPRDTYCMDKAGGVCMFACPGFECDRLGNNWACKDKQRIGGGSTSVCIGD